ncbi:MAG: hypothetical protein K0V04_06385 [Deltaproteobacteria bacterium]|nr:hypothetical protein [Deltaproteobacteria bacterium]
MTTEPTHGDVTAQELHAYFDDELAADRAKAVSLALESDPHLRAEYDQLGGFRSTVAASFEANAEAVPAARFEQIWDEIDRAIERDERLQSEADRNASVWTRMWAAFKPVRVPVFAAAAAALVTVVVLRPGADETNKSPAMASVEEDSTSPAVVGPAPTEPKPTPLIADSKASPVPPSQPEPTVTPPMAPMPVPDENEAEIHGIKFGHGGGRIANTGTVTVLYVDDETEPTDSERSL